MTTIGSWLRALLCGPQIACGDCLWRAPEIPRLLWLDPEAPLRSGDIVVWLMPSCEPWQQQAAKWLLEVDGEAWLACKYFATKRRADYHVPLGRVVSIWRLPARMPLVYPEYSARIRREMHELRANPPQRPDLVVFEKDLLDHAVIKAAIRAHVAKWRALDLESRCQRN